MIRWLGRAGDLVMLYLLVCGVLANALALVWWLA